VAVCSLRACTVVLLIYFLVRLDRPCDNRVASKEENTRQVKEKIIPLCLKQDTSGEEKEEVCI